VEGSCRQVETSAGYNTGEVLALGDDNTGAGAEKEALDSQGNRHMIPVLNSSRSSLPQWTMGYYIGYQSWGYSH
jgi:hypothetical protein